MRAAVVGWPIQHSRSPLIHSYWLKRYCIAGEYTKIAVAPEEAPAFFARLADQNLAGCNVTVPLKELAFAAAVQRDASAVAVGAANTLWLDEAGRLCAANSDTYGFMRHLDLSAHDWRRGGSHVSILGAGGAARAIVHGFLEAGVDDVRVFNRTRDRAEALAAHFGPRVSAHDWAAREAGSRQAGVLVNTTTIGMKGEGRLDIAFAGFDRRCVVADIVYVPLETEFLAAARAGGLRTVDGLGMLLHQAVPGFLKWFGVEPEVTPELRALIEADIRGAV